MFLKPVIVRDLNEKGNEKVGLITVVYLLFARVHDYYRTLKSVYKSYLFSHRNRD